MSLIRYNVALGRFKLMQHLPMYTWLGGDHLDKDCGNISEASQSCLTALK